MWEDRFASSDGFLFGTAPSTFLRDNPWLYSGGTALCVADGEGRNSVHLAKAGMEVTAFDLSLTAIGRAKTLATEAGVSVEAIATEWDGWDWSRSFDTVFGILIQFVGPEARIAQFNDLDKAVKPGGRLVLHGYRPEQIEYGTGGPPSADNMYTDYDTEQQSGRMHVGMSALIDFVARKPN